MHLTLNEHDDDDDEGRYWNSKIRNRRKIDKVTEDLKAHQKKWIT
jgi:hypothetical protein